MGPGRGKYSLATTSGCAEAIRARRDSTTYESVPDSTGDETRHSSDYLASSTFALVDAQEIQ